VLPLLFPEIEATTSPVEPAPARILVAPRSRTVLAPDFVLRSKRRIIEAGPVISLVPFSPKKPSSAALPLPMTVDGATIRVLLLR
jgi:hypothetical protein